MEQLIEFGVFTGKIVIVFMFILGLVVLALNVAFRNKMKPEFEIEDINQKLDDLSLHLKSLILEKKEFKKFLKESKSHHQGDLKKPRTFVLKFEGDIHASRVEQFRDEITTLLTVAEKQDEVVIVIESPGGTVHGYGLAAAQILRLKDAGIKVTACVDKVAASGGYMMACTAHQILAAPFAIIGSIGVLAQVPNFHRLLKKMNVDYEEISAGEYKRTVSVLGEITDKGRAKFKQQIEETHVLFKEFVGRERPQVEMDKVATGEYWFGTQAKELKLVDEIKTSDAYLLEKKDTHHILSVKLSAKKKLSEKISEAMSATLEKTVLRLYEKLRLL